MSWIAYGYSYAAPLPPGYGASSAGTDPWEVFVYVLEEAKAGYTPCFSWRVLDPAGNVREGAPVCLKERVEPPGSFFGCSVARDARGAQGTAFLVLLGAMLTVWRVRRRPVV